MCSNLFSWPCEFLNISPSKLSQATVGSILLQAVVLTRQSNYVYDHQVLNYTSGGLGECVARG